MLCNCTTLANRRWENKEELQNTFCHSLDSLKFFCFLLFWQSWWLINEVFHFPEKRETKTKRLIHHGVANNNVDCTIHLHVRVGLSIASSTILINTNKSGVVSLYRILVDCYYTNYSDSCLSQLVVVSKTRFNASSAVDLSTRELKL